MELTDNDVTHILRLLEESRFEEVEIEWKGLRIRATKNPSGLNPRAGALSAVSANAANAEPAPRTPAPPAPSQHAAGLQEKGAAIATVDKHDPALAEVKAPVLGTFYRRPEPGAEPFVKVGDRVGPEQTMCLLEVMKVYTAITAGVAGTIEQICVEDGQLVDYSQVLFLIRPDGSVKNRGVA